MVVYHAGGLHVGVANGGAEEFKAALFHVFTDGVGNGGAGHYLFGMIDNGFAAGHKAVQVSIERAELFLYADEQFGIVDGRQYF